MRAITAALVGLVAVAGLATESRAEPIQIGQPWARATAPGAPTGAAFMVLNNNGSQPDLLIGAATPVADRTELHTHLMDDGIMRMRQVEAIEVAPGSPTVLEPGGLHVMLMGLQEPLVEGETFPLTLDFQDAGEITIDVTIQSIMSSEPAGDHDHQMN